MKEDKKKEAVKKVIAAMTIGTKVWSPLKRVFSLSIMFNRANYLNFGFLM
jgi:hypothetical protein